MTREEYDLKQARAAELWEQADIGAETMRAEIRELLVSIDEITPTYERVQDSKRAAVSRVAVEEFREQLEDELLEDDELRFLGQAVAQQLITMSYVIANGGPDRPRPQGLLARLFRR